MPEQLPSKPASDQTTTISKAPSENSSLTQELGAGAGAPLFLRRAEVSAGQSPAVQLARIVNRPGDKFEQQADAVAQHALGSAAATPASGLHNKERAINFQAAAGGLVIQPPD